MTWTRERGSCSCCHFTGSRKGSAASEKERDPQWWIYLREREGKCRLLSPVAYPLPSSLFLFLSLVARNAKGHRVLSFVSSFSFFLTYCWALSPIKPPHGKHDDLGMGKQDVSSMSPPDEPLTWDMFSHRPITEGIRANRKWYTKEGCNQGHKSGTTRKKHHERILDITLCLCFVFCTERKYLYKMITLTTAASSSRPQPEAEPVKLMHLPMVCSLKKL